VSLRANEFYGSKVGRSLEDLSCGNPLRYETGTRKLTTSLLSPCLLPDWRPLFINALHPELSSVPRAGPDRKMGSRVPSTLSGLYPPDSIPVSPLVLSLSMPASSLLPNRILLPPPLTLLSRARALSRCLSWNLAHHITHPIIHHSHPTFLARASSPLIVCTECTGNRKILDYDIIIIIIASISARRPSIKWSSGPIESLRMSPSRPDHLDASLITL
jgi:hypothetical protein